MRDDIPCDLEKRLNELPTTEPMALAICTVGPSFPTERPEAMTRGCGESNKY